MLYNENVVPDNKGASMTECVPARLRNGEIARNDYAMRIARQALTEREGPPPTTGRYVCRHLCQNDSMMRNGFLCVIHTTWGSYYENYMDIPVEKRGTGRKIVGNREHTCPHCKKEGVGPVMFKHHFNRCKLRPQ
jgi:hypothetical protein